MEDGDANDAETAAGGAVARASTWSRASGARASAWALAARETHASVDVGFRVSDRDRRISAAVLAGGVAYRFFFWLLALALFLGGLLGFADAGAVAGRLSEESAGAVLVSAVTEAAQTSQEARWWLLVLGAWLLLWTGYMAAKALVLVHATVWGLPPARVGNALRASLVFTGATLGVLAALASARWLRHASPSLGLVATIAVVLIPFCFWLTASRALPHRATGWRDLAPGAAVVALGVETLHLLTAYLLGPRLTNATELYGSLGIATTILFWLYIVGRLVIAAAVLNASLVDRRAGTVVDA